MGPLSKEPLPKAPALAKIINRLFKRWSPPSFLPVTGSELTPQPEKLINNSDIQKKLTSISSHRQRGHFIEEQVKAWLIRQGITILKQNFTTNLGEIDLIGKDQQGWLIFFEVKHRTHQRYGSAAEQVTINKQNRIRKVAEQFIQQHHSNQLPLCRFDVICTETDQLWINWIKAAF